MAITVLHLSDLHAGRRAFRDIDEKEVIPGVKPEELLNRLTRYLESFPKAPDYVAITGDLTNACDREGFETAKSWLREGIKAGLLPAANRILITPGNHDVQWKIAEENGWHKKRYNDFWELFGKAYPHAHIPDLDPKLNPREPPFDPAALGVIGGLRTEVIDGAVEVPESHPFLLDLSNDILLFAFNSSLACGVFRKDNYDICKSIDALITLFGGQEPASEAKLKETLEAYRKSLLIDSGYIGNDQVDYFARLMTRIKYDLGSRYQNLTKIALLHHHVSHLWEQQLEVKNFESVIDAAQLKQKLVEYEFDLVLHGHKHTNHVALDASIIPISSKELLRPICIVSGGTVCGFPKPRDKQTFKLITLNEKRGPRSTASILEVPLEDRGDPGRVIQNSPVYNVPISSQLPAIHDLKGIKANLDSYLKAKLAPELVNPKGLVVTGGGILQPARPDIVADSAGYHFDCLAEKEGSKIFYDLMLAATKIDFRQRARMYMFLSYVKGLAEAEGDACKIVLLIGNLEESHFFRGTKRGEVKESIKKLAKWFGPSVRSGSFEIRTHNFTQDEVATIAGAIAEN